MGKALSNGKFSVTCLQQQQHPEGPSGPARSPLSCPLVPLSTGSPTLTLNILSQRRLGERKSRWRMGGTPACSASMPLAASLAMQRRCTQLRATVPAAAASKTCRRLPWLTYSITRQGDGPSMQHPAAWALPGARASAGETTLRCVPSRAELHLLSIFKEKPRFPLRKEQQDTGKMRSHPGTKPGWGGGAAP